MAIPSKVTLTPQASVTIAEGVSTDASSEFWQLVTGSVFKVFEGVPYSLAQNILQSSDPDTVIKTQLSGYPQKIVHV